MEAVARIAEGDISALLDAEQKPFNNRLEASLYTYLTLYEVNQAGQGEMQESAKRLAQWLQLTMRIDVDQPV